ncbi:unnamed protein product, partial [Hapterophycus canaliculatus]
GANVESARPFDGYNALNMAAEMQRKDIVQILLEAGADPNIPNIENVTPLHFAAKLRDAGITSDFLVAGADQMRISLGKQLWPIHFASLMFATMKALPKIANVLIEVGGANVNVSNDHGGTIVQMSARLRDVTAGAVLVRVGVDLFAKDVDG